MENIIIEKINSCSPELVDEINHLLKQLKDDHELLTLENAQEMMSQTSNKLFVAKDSDTKKVIGMITLVVYRIPLFKKGVLEDMVVDNEYRGKGIGTMLMNKAIEQARSEKVLFIQLTSNPKREVANKWYQSLGFEKSDTNVYKLFL